MKNHAGEPPKAEALLFINDIALGDKKVSSEIKSIFTDSLTITVGRSYKDLGNAIHGQLFTIKAVADEGGQVGVSIEIPNGEGTKSVSLLVPPQSRKVLVQTLGFVDRVGRDADKNERMGQSDE